MTSPALRAQRRNGLPIIAFVVVALVVAGVVFGAIWLTRDRNAGSAATPTGSPERLHVTDLMAKANCDGNVVGTQMFSYETGRCRLAGVEVTIAVFETGEQRDQWLATARQFGGTLVAGVGWAAGMDRPDAAPILAAALGGQVV